MEAQKERMINENETYLGDAACVFCGAQPLLNAAERTSFYSLYCPRGCGVSVIDITVPSEYFLARERALRLIEALGGMDPLKRGKE